MPPKRELSPKEIEEIRALRGQLSAAEAKKRYRIGSTRLYKIWHDEPNTYPADTTTLSVSIPVAEEEESASPGVLEEHLPTVSDIYNRLGRLESHTEHATNLLGQVLAQLSHHDDDDFESNLLEELLAEQQEDHEEIAEEMQETQSVETAQKWALISFVAMLVWKVASRTWNRRTPVAIGHKIQKQGHTEKPQLQRAENVKPGHPFYME